MKFNNNRILLAGALALASVFVPVCASTVTMEQARVVASEFLRGTSMQMPSRAPLPLSMAYAATNAVTGDPDYYVFNRGTDGGFVIVGGDDCVLPVWGYSPSGSFDPDNVPPAMQFWLEQFEDQLAYARSHPGLSLRQEQQLDHEVAPLMETKWNQGTPYNKKCPTYTKNGTKMTCVTGCVATAVAQIMRYHNWPPQGHGSHAFYCHVNGSSDSTLLSTDFSQSSYKWALMLKGYSLGNTPAYQSAVALLMKDVGYAVNMQYGSSSGAYSEDVPGALINYFDYDESLQYLIRADYDDETWETILRDELDAGRPIYYSGVGKNSDMGHAFVFDGYNADGYFHVNWGWGGQSDGYFPSLLLSPTQQGIGSSEGGYNYYQDAVIGIRPSLPSVFACEMGRVTLDPDSVAALPVVVRTSRAVKSMSVDVELPEALSLRDVTMNDMLAGGYTLSVEPLGDRIMRMTVTSTADSLNAYYRSGIPLFKSPEGMTAIILHVAAEAQPGSQLAVKLTNAGMASFVEGLTLDADDTTGFVTVIGGEPITGDVNQDGLVDVTDVSLLIDIVLGKNTEPAQLGLADINDDSRIDVTDVSALIDIALGKTAE